MKAKAPASDTKPLALTLAMSNDSVDDDDDFQNPSQAIAITQNLILSSLKNPNFSQPLKQLNGPPPPRKRQKPSVSSGMENRRSKQVTKSTCSRVPNLCNEGKVLKAVNLQNGENSLRNSRVSRDLEEGEAVGEERRQLSGSVGSGSLVSQSSFIYDSCVSSICDDGKMATAGDEVKEENLRLLTSEDSNIVENCQNEEFVIRNLKEERGSFYSMSIESRLLEPKTKLYSSNVGDVFGNIDLRLEEKNLKSVEEFDFGKLDGCEDTMCQKAGKGSYYSKSFESRLLESRVKCDSINAGDCDGDFEPGTQLNVLMDLCNEIGEGCLNDCDFSFEENGFARLGDESFQLEKDGFVECPLCGADITHLSEELRQVHTNDCLDNDGTTEVAIPAHEIRSHSPHPVADVNPVLEWLRSLGLSKYEEAFVKEEVDWETLQWLTEEDLLSIGVVALGPRKKIVHALNELRQKSSHGQESTENANSVIPVNENTKTLAPGNKLITEYFPGPAIGRNRPCNQSNTRNGIEKVSKDSVRKRSGPRNHANRGKVKDIPLWCRVPGTPFLVDAFRFLRGDCSHWFLTHFHMDHYQGLTKNFCHGKIYCSSITAHLVNMKIGVPWERLQILPLNQKINVVGVNLTCLDANHCPGSIIILFEPPNGKAVLHTGDFRFSAEMAGYSVLRSCHVHTLVLDTTYCNPQYDFPMQEAVIQFVIEAIQAEAFNPKTLFLIGTYTIGKERLFLEVARLLKRKVYVGAAKLRLLRCLELREEDMQWFTANENESHIHVVPMWTIASFKRMKHISNQYSDRFNLIVAFSPTGWTFGKGKKKTPGRRWQQGTIIRYEVPYSEHSSFTELREFVQFISPEHIIPSVNNKGPESTDAMISLLMSDS